MEIVVRVSADCPLIDAAVIDRTIEKFNCSGADYCSNTLRLAFPDGLDTEVFSFAALKRAWNESDKPPEREHVTPYIRDPWRFKLVGLEAPKDYSLERWTVDEPADLEFVRSVFQEFKDRPHFDFEDV